MTTDKERLAAEIELRKLDMAADLAQMEVNKAEATSSSVLTSPCRNIGQCDRTSAKSMGERSAEKAATRAQRSEIGSGDSGVIG